MAIVDRVLGQKKESLEITSPYMDTEDDCLSCRVLGESFLFLRLLFYVGDGRGEHDDGRGIGRMG